MKKVFFGLLVAATALGASAFTNAKTAAASKFAVIYYQHNDGIYSLVQPTNSCGVAASNPCTISYAVDPGELSFSYADRPLTSRTESTVKAKGAN